MKPLTSNQKFVLESLRRKGADWIAAATERAWKSGESYYIDSRCPARKGLAKSFNQGNIEATTKQTT